VQRRRVRVLKRDAGVSIRALAQTASAQSPPVLTTVYNFQGGPGDGATSVAPLLRAPLAFGEDGSLYGATKHGGTKGFSTVFAVNLQ